MHPSCEWTGWVEHDSKKSLREIAGSKMRVQNVIFMHFRGPKALKDRLPKSDAPGCDTEAEA